MDNQEENPGIVQNQEDNSKIVENQREELRNDENQEVQKPTDPIDQLMKIGQEEEKEMFCCDWWNNKIAQRLTVLDNQYFCSCNLIWDLTHLGLQFLIILFATAFAIEIFQASVYSIFYKFVYIGTREATIDIFLSLISVFSDFGIFFMALVFVFNLLSVDGVVGKLLKLCRYEKCIKICQCAKNDGDEDKQESSTRDHPLEASLLEPEKPFEQPKTTEQQAEQANATEQPVEQPKATEQQAEQTDTTEKPVEQANATEQPVEQPKATEQPVEQTDTTEKPVEQANATGQQLNQSLIDSFESSQEDELEELTPEQIEKQARRCENWKQCGFDIVAILIFAGIIALCYFCQTVLAYSSAIYMMILFIYSALVGPTLYYFQGKIPPSSDKKYLDIIFKTIRMLMVNSNDLKNENEDEDDKTKITDPKYAFINDIRKERKSMIDIETVQDDVADSFESLQTIAIKRLETISDQDKFNKEYKTYYSVLKYGQSLWDTSYDSIEKGLECCKCLNMSRSHNMLGWNDYESKNTETDDETPNNDDDNCCCFLKSTPLPYKIIISVLVFAGQICGIVEASRAHQSSLAIYIICRLFLAVTAIDYNIIDSIVFHKRTLKVIGGGKKLALIALYIFYVLGTICAIIAIFSAHSNSIITYDFPEVKSVFYTNNNDTWTRSTYAKNEIPAFCSSTGTVDSTFTTDDFAFMTTLPRLYEKVNGKCIINPNLRGVFNNTMKYIFGENYKDQGIKIYCYYQSQIPYLIITSDELFDYAKGLVTNPDEYTLGKTQEVDEPKDYFDVNNLCQDGIAPKECWELKYCLDRHYSTCKDEWQNYTSKYWEEYNFTGNDDFSEFNNYQIDVPDNKEKFFYARIVNKNDRSKDVPGQHFIVGGGWEDIWGMGYQVEILIRSAFSSFFGAIIPFYSMFESMLPEFYRGNEINNGRIFGITRKQENEHKYFEKLINKFDFDTNNIYTIGHSISAATMKGYVATKNIPGIAFETKSTTAVAFSSKPIVKNVGKNRVNVHSQDMVFTSNDESYDVDGMLIKKFYNPNVYDTACLTTVMCSKTKKYVPFCQQVLSQHGNDPVQKFQEIIDAYDKSRKINIYSNA